jgi:gamma-glutamylcyclotransferase (GGCT)/AIG2-like uncharacterized protein YtfP
MPGQEPVHLFVYGTLTDPQRVEALTGKQFARVEATLVGFARYESGSGYPYILPQPGAVVHGVLLTHIDPQSLHHLDAYEAEGDLYRRQVVEVVVAGRTVPAMTYVGQAVGATAQDAVQRQHDSAPPDRSACETSLKER